MLVLAAMMVAVAAASNCPTSDIPLPPGTRLPSVQMTISTNVSCAIVKAEIHARIASIGGWNGGGIYTLVSEMQFGPVFSMMSTTWTAKLSRAADKQSWKFIDMVKNGSCLISACSISQDMFYFKEDHSTNYCNIHNLYCNGVHCHPIHSFSSIETKMKPADGAGTNASMCNTHAFFPPTLPPFPPLATAQLTMLTDNNSLLPLLAFLFCLIGIGLVVKRSMQPRSMNVPETMLG